eukprot:TRINITY_DN8187_c0_g1_i1.p1 TRINITY_DN8187_c0_g1~~TRINITY_DN8187_c0_g1_i1.p1  ORF type:complete len:559 (+),score=145.13 TRINITY_DN8187_c0_g1_i1:52-1728(+)
MGQGKKSGHGRAGGKRHQGVGGGGESSKRDGVLRLQKKDPGLPNLGEYSNKMERVLNKQRKKNNIANSYLKKRQKLDQESGIASNIKGSMALYALAANNTNNEFRAKEQFAENQTTTNRSKENSRKRFWKEFQKVVKVSDVLLEVLDARDPLGCRLREVERVIDSQYAGKKKFVLVLNKVDLVPKEAIEKWLEYFRVEGLPVVAFSASGGGKAAGQDTGTSHQDPTHRCVHHLFEVLRRFQKTDMGGRKRITVGIVGFPNVGKSSVINALKRDRVVHVGNTPGVTTSAQEVSLQGHVKIVDCPGVVMSDGTEAEIVLRNAMKIEHIVDPIRPVELIVERCGVEMLSTIYGIGRYNGFEQFMTLLAERKGKLLKGGKPNIDDVCRVVLKDWNDGRIHFYTTPPADRDFVQLPDTLRLTSAEEEGEKTILNKLSSTATDFVCLTNKPVEATYQIDETALQAKRKADMSSDDEESSLDNGQHDTYNPFSMYSDKNTQQVNMQGGGFLEDDDDEEMDMADLAEQAAALREQQVETIQSGMNQFRKSKKKMLKTATKNLKKRR